MPTKLFLKPFCARYTTKLTSNLKWYDSTTGYLQLRLRGQFPKYIKVEVLPQVKTRGCLLAVFKEKPAELTITPDIARPCLLTPTSGGNNSHESAIDTDLVAIRATK